MSPLRMRMIEDMKLAGLSPGTQATYIAAVRKLAAQYRRSPDQLSEEEVRAYFVSLRERGAARGTFKANYYGIQYLYRYTLNRDWALFSKKHPPAEAEAVAPRARRRRGSPAAALHNEPDPQNLLCRHVCLRSADRRGRNP
jgi:Phage integrase, N-terminal SAM-like domain